MAELEQKAFLQSVGCIVSDYMSFDEYDDCDEDEGFPAMEDDIVQQIEQGQFPKVLNGKESELDGESENTMNTDRSRIIDLKSGFVLDILQQVDYNWQLQWITKLTSSEQARLAYLSEIEQKQRRIEEIIDESRADEEVGCQMETMSEEKVKQRLKVIKDKGKRRAR